MAVDPQDIRWICLVHARYRYERVAGMAIIFRNEDRDPEPDSRRSKPVPAHVARKLLAISEPVRNPANQKSRMVRPIYVETERPLNWRELLASLRISTSTGPDLASLAADGDEGAAQAMKQLDVEDVAVAVRGAEVRAAEEARAALLAELRAAGVTIPESVEAPAPAPTTPAPPTRGGEMHSFLQRPVADLVAEIGACTDDDFLVRLLATEQKSRAPRARIVRAAENRRIRLRDGAPRPDEDPDTIGDVLDPEAPPPAPPKPTHAERQTRGDATVGDLDRAGIRIPGGRRGTRP